MFGPYAQTRMAHVMEDDVPAVDRSQAESRGELTLKLPQE